MIEIVFGIVLSIVSPGEAKADPASIIYKGIITGNKIIQKEKQGTIDDSIHEEVHQTVKDILRKGSHH
jgi:hypothetical protein